MKLFQRYENLHYKNLSFMITIKLISFVKFRIFMLHPFKYILNSI